MRYISLFSGIGGLEHATTPPLLLCEKDAACRSVLQRRFFDLPIWEDVSTLASPPRADLVVGGWPCQDLSAAGSLGGINGARSVLFFDMLRVARAARAETIVGENVPNLLRINKGADFKVVLNALRSEGFPYVAWRVLNARNFGLPQERRRLIIVASRDITACEALHSTIPAIRPSPKHDPAYAFYWTAGTRSICFSNGYAPALKIGATDNNGRSPVAVFARGVIRKLTPTECLRLQGFTAETASHLSNSTALRMAGNAVPKPLGEWVMGAIEQRSPMTGTKVGFGAISPSGLMNGTLTWDVAHSHSPLASDLARFLEHAERDHLSAQAAAGLIARSIQASQPMPVELFDHLMEIGRDRTAPLRPSRGNSFELLDSLSPLISEYRAQLPSIMSFESGGDLAAEVCSTYAE